MVQEMTRKERDCFEMAVAVRHTMIRSLELLADRIDSVDPEGVQKVQTALDTMEEVLEEVCTTIPDYQKGPMQQFIRNCVCDIRLPTVCSTPDYYPLSRKDANIVIGGAVNNACFLCLGADDKKHWMNCPLRKAVAAYNPTDESVKNMMVCPYYGKTWDEKGTTDD